jgi:hypothetical protein
MRPVSLTHEQLSILIGIYDWAIEPDQWPATIAEICRAIGCLNGLGIFMALVAIVGESRLTANQHLSAFEQSPIFP